MAVDDAYSRYVMTLSPRVYLRMRGLVVGDRVVEDEVRAGLDGQFVAKCALERTLVAGNIRAGALLPAFPAGTALSVGRSTNLNFVKLGWYGSHDAYTSSTANTNNWQCKAKFPPPAHSATYNIWYINNADLGAVNARMLAIPNAEFSNSTDIFVTNLFAWNSTAKDNLLVEAVFRLKNKVWGSTYMANQGGNETYRYISTGQALVHNVVHMATLRFDRGSMAIFRDGVKMQETVYNPDIHRPVAHGMTYSSQWMLGAAIWAHGSSSGSDRCESSFSDVSVHNIPLTDEQIADLYALGTTGVFPRSVQGTVTDGLGVGIVRLVRAHSQVDGRLLGESTSLGDGTFSIPIPSEAAYETMYVMAFDDLGVAPDYNAAIQSNVASIT